MEEFLTVTLPVVKLQQLRKHAETERQRNPYLISLYPRLKPKLLPA